MMSIDEVLADPTASYWLKQALRSALDRDCVDAVNDAEILAGLLAEQAGRFITSPAPSAGSSRPDHQETLDA